MKWHVFDCRLGVRAKRSTHMILTCRWALTGSFVAVLACILLAAEPFKPGGPCTRGRVRIEGHTIVTDWGTRLRGGCWWEFGTFPREDLRTAKLCGINAIHLYSAEYSEQPAAKDRHYSNTDSIIEWCRQESLYVVLLGWEGIRGGVDNLINNVGKRDWTFFAPRYKDQTHVVYELFNEPCKATFHCDERVMEEGIKPTYKLVHELAPETHILLVSHSNLKGGMSAIWDDIDRLGTEIDWDHASYAFHGYGTSAGFQEQAVRELAAKGYSSVCTEFPSSKPELVRAYENAEISYFHFRACWTGEWLGTICRHLKGHIGGVTWQPDFGDWPMPHVEHLVSTKRTRASPRAISRGPTVGAFTPGNLPRADIDAVYDITGRLLWHRSFGPRNSSFTGSQVLLAK